MLVPSGLPGGWGSFAQAPKLSQGPGYAPDISLFAGGDDGDDTDTDTD